MIEFYIILWVLLGFLGGIICSIMDLKYGIDFTLKTVAAIIVFSPLGPIMLIAASALFIDKIKDKVLIKAKK